MDDRFPEMLAAAGLAAAWCAEPEQWPVFLDWARAHGYLLAGDDPSRDLMMRASASLDLMIRQVRAELLIMRGERELGDLG